MNRWLSAINVAHTERNLSFPAHSFLVTRIPNGIWRARIRTTKQAEPVPMQAGQTSYAVIPYSVVSCRSRCR